MTPQPHEPDINALVRACDVHNVPCATNVAGARLLLRELERLNPSRVAPPRRSA
jgi:methylglyoxal synthase